MLLLVMLGGAWVPSFVFPGWLQQASLVVPTRWAVDGLADISKAVRRSGHFHLGPHFAAALACGGRRE